MTAPKNYSMIVGLFLRRQTALCKRLVSLLLTLSPFKRELYLRIIYPGILYPEALKNFKPWNVEELPEDKRDVKTFILTWTKACKNNTLCNIH